MPRYKLVVEYDGTAFAGWQRQAADRSVQQGAGGGDRPLRRRAGAGPLRRAHRCGGARDASGRPSRPRQAVAHRHRARRRQRPPAPGPVAVIAAAEVGPDFDARHSAIKRHYRYRILNRRSPPALTRGFVWHVPWALDAALMHEAAQLMLGRHDFSALRAAECQAKQPGAHPRPARRDAGRRGDRRRHRGALVPAPPGPRHGRHPDAGGRRPAHPAGLCATFSIPATAPAADHSRRREG